MRAPAAAAAAAADARRFPLETTIAVARMLLARVFDRHAALVLLLAHGGGTLPFLAGRLESCIAHDAHVHARAAAPARGVWAVLRENILLDAVVYSGLGLRAAVEASGADRVLFGTANPRPGLPLLTRRPGTDHPFFPPLGGEAGEPKWLSVTTNYRAIEETFGSDSEKAAGVLGGNAVRLLKLQSTPA